MGSGCGCGLNDGGEVKWKLVERARLERVKGKGSGDDEQKDIDKWKSNGNGIWKEMGGMRKQRRRRGKVMNR